MHMTNDVFDHDDGIIDQNAYGENQGKQGDPVEGITVEIEYQKGEGQGRRDGKHDHQGFAPAQKDEDQNGHAEYGDAHVQQELVRFLRGRGTVIAGDADFHISWNEAAFQGIDLLEHILDHAHGVCPGTFGDRQSHGSFKFMPRRCAVQHILGGIL